jgi:hypothetical protein
MDAFLPAQNLNNYSMMTTDCAITGSPATHENEENGQNKMKRVFRVPQEEVDYVLSYQVIPWPILAKWYPAAAAELEKIQQEFLVEQEKMRREYEATGYAMFEAEVTDDEEEDAALTAPHDEKDGASATLTSSPWIIPRGRGGRRFFARGSSSKQALLRKYLQFMCIVPI